MFQEAIDEILEDPSVGEEKKGDLKGIKGYDIFYNHTNYELAYTVEYVKRRKLQMDRFSVIIAEPSSRCLLLLRKIKMA